MSLRRLCHLTAICLVVPIATYCYLPPERNTVRAETQNEPAWINFSQADEEFALSVPGNPTTRTYPLYDSRDSKAEKILAHYEYGGYGSGLIYIIHSFKAQRPQRVSDNILSYIQQGAVFERELSIDGIAATESRKTVTSARGTYTLRNVRFITGKHLYLLTLVTLEENNPAIDRFLSSIHWQRSEKSMPAETAAEIVTSNAFNPSEVTRHAIVVSKGAPFYTNEARAHRTVGTVTLEAVFAENGYVTNITVTRGLSNGLNESAIEAARNIRFFPAEKDGKPVSQRTMLEYNFNLY